ncbi:DUF2206 domain-containing protein [Candidatus Bathyarchaeota archaeon]|nr:DUF2206 domain-containing protein [Candidatus Bathyarchaeota archaeon]
MKLVKILVVMQVLFVLSTLLDISIIRQFFGFFYLTFIPGYLLLRIFGISNISDIEKVIFSIATSLAFLMFIGLLTDQLLPIFGVDRPLSFLYLTTVYGISIPILAAILYITRGMNEDVKLPNIASTDLLYFSLPFLCVIGVLFSKIQESNILLLLTLSLIALVFAFNVLKKKEYEEYRYAFIIYVVSLALLFHWSLISSYITGWDIQTEYNVMKTVQNAAYWNGYETFQNVFYGSYYQMLSITVLPVAYSNTLGMDATWVFKILYPVIFSFVPVAIFKFSKSYIGNRGAFIAAFFFMVQGTYYTEMLGLARQMIAEVFLAAFILVVLRNDMNETSKKILLLFFSFGISVSHYSLTYILIFILVAYYILGKLSLARRGDSIRIGIFNISFLISFSFLWYIYSSGSASFINLSLFFNNIVANLGQFFNLGSRGPEVITGLGLGGSGTIWSTINRFLAYITEGMIAIGLLSLYVRRSAKNIDRNFVILCLINSILLAACILIPQFAVSLQMSRFYHILLITLSPLLVLGLEFLLGSMPKIRMKPSAVLFVSIIIIVPYFLGQTHFLYEVVQGDSWSIPLSKYRMGPRLYAQFGYDGESEVFGAEYLLARSQDVNRIVYSELSVYYTLLSYGIISPEKINIVTNATTIASNGIVVFGTLSTKYNIVLRRSVASERLRSTWNFAEIQKNELSNANKIYSNGGCVIYSNP